MSDQPVIQDVSDTALWVAYYRARESDRADALFQDPYAKLLIGHRGEKIAQSMKATARYTEWTVVMRTLIIDKYIQELVASGIDTVINLGAGMDTRPYRMDLPQHLRWIEVDYPHMIEHKEKLLVNEKPYVQLERVSLDLANRDERKKLFDKLNAQSKKALILTEGVVIYLNEQQVASLAEDLHAQPNFQYWITEYFSPQVYRYFKTSKRMEKLKNAPFQFFPVDWFGFFKNHGWISKDVRYFGEQSILSNRKTPYPWWAKILFKLMSEKTLKTHRQNMGYVLFTRANS